MGSYAVIEAPSVLGLHPGGVERLPEVLLGAGLAQRLSARRAGRVEPPPYDDRRDPATLLLNPAGVASYTLALADAVRGVLDAGDVPLVLGGDCSIVLGGLLALRRRGRSGLLFVDGHADFYQPGAEPTGEAASMDLALATGRGPSIVTDPEGLRPLVRDADVALVGYRDAGEAAGAGSQPLPEGLWRVDLTELRRRGAERAAADAVARVTRDELSSFWVHVDADCLDDALMPAVDYRLPGGLTFAELSTVLRAAMGSGRVAGVEVTIFNPALDPSGEAAAGLVDCLVAGLTVDGLS